MSVTPDPPITERTAKCIEFCRNTLADLNAGHPLRQTVELEEDLATWQRETIAIWSTNLVACLGSQVPTLLAEIERLRAVIADRDATIAERSETVSRLVVAVDRYIERSGESDEATRHGLWRAMATAAEATADACGIYPLPSASPEETSS